MWIRTRVGLVALADPFEIRVFKASTGARMILAQTRRTAEGTGKTWFRQLRITNPAFHLAHFADGPSVDAEVGQVMNQIYAAVQSKLDVLDLSGVGSAGAWDASWTQVAWPNGH